MGSWALMGLEKAQLTEIMWIMLRMHVGWIEITESCG